MLTMKSQRRGRIVAVALSALAWGLFATPLVSYAAAPVIDSITPDPLNITEDTSGQVTVAVSDGGDGDPLLTVTASSSNQSVIPNANITINPVTAGTGNRTVTIVPLANQSGLVNIQLTVVDTETIPLQDVEAFSVNVIAENDAPTFPALAADIMVNEDTLSTAVNFSVNDVEGQSVAISASSGNTTLLPNANITLNSLGGNNYSLAVQGGLNQNGSTIVTLSASDGVSTTLDTVAVTINPVNDPPQFVTTPNDTTTQEDTLGTTNSFQVIDVDGPSLTINKASSNTGLLPISNITVANTSGNNYVVTFQGALNASGESDVTLTATDNLLSAQDTFKATITAVNDPPVITAQPDPVSFNEDGSSTTTITVVDPEGGSINLSAISSNSNKVASANITFSPINPGASGAVRTITVPGLPNANGTLSVNLTATDSGNATVNTSFNVNITPVNDLPVFSGVANISFNEDGTGTLTGLNITDADGDSLTLSATSGDTAIVANGGIIVTPATAASGTPRSIQVTGLPNKNGTVQINLSVDDGHGGVVPANFNATIAAVPDAPVITGLIDRTIAEDTTSPDYAFTVIDPDGDAINAVTAVSFDNLVPTGNITITSQGGGNYTIRVTPRPNDAGRFAAVRVEATDSTNLFSRVTTNFNVTRVADTPVYATFPLTQSIVKNSTTGPVLFTSFDGDCDAPVTAIPSAVSANTTLVPNNAANIAVRTLGVAAICGQPNNVGTIGMTATHEIIITPTTNLTGVAVIDVTVTDNSGLKVTRPMTVVVSFTNQAPTFLAQDNELVDTTILEDSSVSLNFFVQDLDNDPIIASATSSNPTLLPLEALAINGTGGSRILVISPAPNINGSATVTVSLTDGISTTTRSFQLTVLPVNDAPLISSVTDQTLAFNGNSGALPFTVSDIETAASQLQVSVASSNPNVIPVGNVILGGSGTNRTVQVAAGITTGSSIISLTVSDGFSSTLESFVVTVVGNNLPPSMSQIADQIIPRNGSVGPLAFTVADDLLPANSLTVTVTSNNSALLPLAGIVLAGSAGSRTIRITPAANVGGSGRITLTVTDGVYNISRGFLVTVPTEGQSPAISAVTPPKNLYKLQAGMPSEAFTFTLSDPDTPLSELAISVISSNPTIIPTNSVVLSGTAGLRSLLITPAVGQAGTVTLTLVVRDGTNVATTSITVFVWRNIYLGNSYFDYKPFNIESSESNNTYARAMPVVTGVEYSGLVYSNSVSAQDTIDVLTLNLSQGNYRITLNFTGADLDVYLRDNSSSTPVAFKTLAKSDSTGNTGPEIINYTETVSTPATRYIVINLYTGSPGNKEYRIRIDKLP